MYAVITYDDGTVTSVLPFRFIETAHKAAALEMAAELSARRSTLSSGCADDMKSVLATWDNGGTPDEWLALYEQMREYAAEQLIPEAIVTDLYDEDVAEDEMLGSVSELRSRFRFGQV